LCSLSGDDTLGIGALDIDNIYRRLFLRYAPDKAAIVKIGCGVILGFFVLPNWFILLLVIIVVMWRKSILINLQANIGGVLCTNCDFFPINKILHIILKLHTSEGGMTLHPVKLAKFIILIPRSVGLVWVDLLGRQKLNEVFLDQFVKNNIQWLTKGCVSSRCRLKSGLWSCSYIDGVSLVVRPLKVGLGIVVLIILLMLLLVVGNLLVVWLIRWVGLTLGRTNNIYMSGVGNPICGDMLVFIPISRFVIGIGLI
jgi:hypothetical protein